SLGVDRKRQRLGLRLNLDLGDDQLHLAGIELGVDRVDRPRGDLSRQRDHAFQPQSVGDGKQRRGHVDDALGDAVMISQIAEEKLAVVTLAMEPPRKAGGATRIGKAQRCASVGPVGVHRGKSIPWAGNTARKAALVKAGPWSMPWVRA